MRTGGGPRGSLFSRSKRRITVSKSLSDVIIEDLCVEEAAGTEFLDVGPFSAIVEAAPKD